MEVAHLLAHPDWANYLILLDQLSAWSSWSICCKYVLVYFSIERDFIRISCLIIHWESSLGDFSYDQVCHLNITCFSVCWRSFHWNNSFPSYSIFSSVLIIFFLPTRYFLFKTLLLERLWACDVLLIAR